MQQAWIKDPMEGGILSKERYLPRRFSETLQSRHDDGWFRPSGVVPKPKRGGCGVAPTAEADEVKTSEGRKPRADRALFTG
jgi:hypothetical protein